MLTDNEIKRSEDDSLQYKSLCDSLVSIALKSQTPLTIGVFGEWGSGKTSLMRLTENELANQNIKTVWFNAWKFDKAFDLRVALIHSILKEIENDKTALQSVKDKAVGLLKRVNWLGLGRTAVNVGASLLTPYLAILPMLSQVLSTSKKGTENFSKLLPDELLKEQSEGKTLELIGEFEEEFGKLALEYVGPDGRLVVFVDDLDRCLPEKALDILEAIKLFLNVPQSIFIIGTDVKVIENGLIQKYGDKSQTLAKNYLDKIIQVPFRIPPLSKEDIKDHFIPKLQISDELKDYAFIIADAGNNPRTIKRLLNNIELQRVLSKARDITVEDIILVKLNVLEFRWKEFHSDLVELYAKSNENLLKIVDEYENADEKRKEELIKEKPVLNNYITNFELLDFLNKEPSLDNIEVAPYIHIQKTTSSTGVKDEYGGDIDKYFQLGFSSYTEKDYIKAIDYYTRVITLNPNYRQAYYNRGLACYNMDYYKRAINDFTKSIQIDKEDKASYYWIGGAYSSLNNYDAAIENYSTAIQLDPAYINAYNYRGLAYLDKKEFEKAIIDFTECIKLNPEYAEAYYNRALASIDIKKYAESLADNTRAIELSPQYTNAYINRGLTYDRMNDYEKALGDYALAISITPSSDLAYNNFMILVSDILKKEDPEKKKIETGSIRNIITKSELPENKKTDLLNLLDKIG